MAPKQFFPHSRPPTHSKFKIFVFMGKAWCKLSKMLPVSQNGWVIRKLRRKFDFFLEILRTCDVKTCIKSGHLTFWVWDLACQAYIPCLKGRRKNSGECEKIECFTRHGNAYQQSMENCNFANRHSRGNTAIQICTKPHQARMTRAKGSSIGISQPIHLRHVIKIISLMCNVNIACLKNKCLMS